MTAKPTTQPSPIKPGDKIILYGLGRDMDQPQKIVTILRGTKTLAIWGSRPFDRDKLSRLSLPTPSELRGAEESIRKREETKQQEAARLRANNEARIERQKARRRQFVEELAMAFGREPGHLLPENYEAAEAVIDRIASAANMGEI